ncbi:MAG: hypothetical protein ACFCUO_01040 [Rhodospirillales bacterium]
MAPEKGAAGTPRPDRLSLIVYSGTFERVHYALVLAAAAAAVGTPATLFFTMDGCRALLRAGEDGSPSWRRLPAGEGEDGERGHPGGVVDDRYRARGVAGFDELITACAELGVRFLVCEMGLRAKGLTGADLRADLPLEETGVVTLLADASANGAMLLV